MARKKKFRKNWRKAKARITQLHTKVANIRKDFLHKVSNDISKNHVVVVVEDLQVKSMSRSATKKVAQKSGLNRAILDASPFELRRQLEYKTQWQGGLLVPVTTKHQPQVSRVWARIGGEPQVASKVRLWRVRILGPCGFRRCREYQRGGTRLASLLVVFG